MSAPAPVPFPGMASPAAGFDQPFEMLGACHERVRRTLALMQRLVAHVQAHGVDANARSAAGDVWRYFEVAGPAHHEDEERHVIPLLLASGDATLMAAARQMRAYHERMDAVWATLSMRLRLLRDGADGAMPGDALARLAEEVRQFVAIHDTHVPLEDAVAFPAARSRTNAAGQAAMGAEMAARRGARR